MSKNLEKIKKIQPKVIIVDDGDDNDEELVEIVNNNKTDYVKFEEIIQNNIDFEDELLLYTLLRIVTKLCKKEGSTYIFDLSTETKEAGEYIMECANVVKKMVPDTNTAYFSKCKKKVYAFIKYLCDDLNNLDIAVTTKKFNVISKEHPEKKTTKNVHYVTGLI